jgi:hypothetical protein
MPAWLVEGRPAVYFFLTCLFLAAFALWWRTRTRRHAIVAGVLAALIGGYFLLDRFVESDGEQMVRKVREIARAVSSHSLAAGFDEVSESFDRPPRKKRDFRDYCESVLRRGWVSRVQVWDLTPMDISRDARTGSVEFRFKVDGSWGESPPNYIARATFTLDNDGQWRLKTFNLYDTLNQSTVPVPIPGW